VKSLYNKAINVCTEYVLVQCVNCEKGLDCERGEAIEVWARSGRGYLVKGADMW